MSLSHLFDYWRIPVTKTRLAVIVTLYLSLLNMVSSNDIAGSLFYGIWPAFLTLSLLLLFSLLPRQAFRLLLMTFVVTASIAVFFKSRYNAIITEDILLSAWINDFSLSLEMLSLNLCLWFFFTAILPVLYILVVPIKKLPFMQQCSSSLGNALFAMLTMSSIFFLLGFEIKEEGHIRDPGIANSLSYFSPADVIHAAKNARKAHKEFRKQYAHVSQLSEKYRYDLDKDMQDVLVLVIIGETARGDRFSLNDYEKNTNPYLATVENLYSFSNVSSCNTITIRAMKCLFSRVTAENRTQDITESAFTDVFRSLGFTAEIYSLQSMTDIYNYLGYDKLVSKYTVLRSSAMGAKDEALLPFLQDAINTQQGNKLVLLHTLGSHQTYNDRLTKNHKHFQPSCTYADVSSCSPESLNNAYDNTIVATDAFIYNAINMLEDKKAVVLYISDHGESLGENGIYYHGMPPDMAPKEQFDIPFIIWLSKPLIATEHGQQINNRLAALNRHAAYSQDNFFHSVIGCAGISSPDGGLDDQLNLCQKTAANKISATF